MVPKLVRVWPIICKSWPHPTTQRPRAGDRRSKDYAGDVVRRSSGYVWMRSWLATPRCSRRRASSAKYRRGWPCFSHSPGTAAIVDQTRRPYPGRVEMGEDLKVIDIGAEVHVKSVAGGGRPR